MGTITVLTSKTKGTRYKAVIQIRRKKEGIDYFDTKTFSTRALAKAWIKKEEDRLEKNPELLSTNVAISEHTTLKDAIEKYMKEVSDFGESKAYCLKQIQKFDIAQKPVMALRRSDFGEHAQRRQEGYINVGLELKPVKPQTINFELQCIKSVLDYAELVWGVEINIVEYEKAIRGLRKARIVSDSDERQRLASSDELQRITTVSYIDFHYSNNPNTPIYLVMWLAIYTARRLNEIVRLKIKDYDRHNKKWFIEGIKHPDGSKGNDKWFVVSDKAARVIEQLLEPDVRKKMLSRGGDDQYLIPTHPQTIDKNWRKYRERAKIEGLNFHDLRHEAATRLAEAGESIAKIMQYTLHDDLNSLKRYINLDVIRKDLLDFEQALQIAKNTSVDTFLRY